MVHVLPTPLPVAHAFDGHKLDAELLRLCLDTLLLLNGGSSTRTLPGRLTWIEARVHVQISRDDQVVFAGPALGVLIIHLGAVQDTATIGNARDSDERESPSRLLLRLASHALEVSLIWLRLPS